MSLFNGTLSLRRHMVLGPFPGDDALAEALARDRFRPFEDGLEEERLGWVDWRNPLVVPADPSWIRSDAYQLFALRIDTRKVPSALLKAHVALRIERLREERDLAFIGKDQRVSIAEEIKCELLRKVLPRVTVFEVAVDARRGVLFTTATGNKAAGALTSLCLKSFGCEIQQVGPLLFAGMVRPNLPSDALMALEPLSLEIA